MAAVHLANATGGSLFLGFISAVAFATILAVVAGLDPGRRLGRQPRPLCGGHRTRDDRPNRRRSGSRRSRPIAIGVVAIFLGYIFENQNVAFMVGLAFAVAASCNFPVLLMSVFWKGTTTRGALIGGLLGLVSAVDHGGAEQGRLGSDLRLPERDFPLRQPGYFLDADCVRRNLGFLQT